MERTIINLAVPAVFLFFFSNISVMDICEVSRVTMFNRLVGGREASFCPD